MYFETPAWDLSLFTLLNQEWRSAALDAVMPLFSWSLLLWLAVGVGLLLILWRRGARTGLLFLVLVLAGLGVSDLACSGLKDAFGRVRPLNVLEGVHYRQVGEWRVRPPGFESHKEEGTSYPSAHAANSVAAVLIAALLFPALRPWLFLLPLLVGYSRVYLGKHYPSDVLAGWLVGLAAVLLVWAVWRFLQPAIRSRSNRA